MTQLQRRGVATDKAPAPAFAYSQGVVANGFCFISGQVPMHPDTRAVPDAFEAQVRQTLDNVAAIAEGAGGRLADAVRMTVYLADLEDFEEMDTVYRSYFADPLPARTTIGTGIKGFRIEIDAIVALPTGA